ncbi:MAG: hypothetical protein C0623_01040 [Desulfuromonas sp.]|nr:MAG: hypothetical protein C0623_01040 [Desulfuromonas sp.]
MRYLGIGLVFLALIASGLVGMYFAGSFDQSSGAISETVSVGQPAPDFELRDKDGGIYSLSSLRGKVVLVNFWATWCPPCRSEIPSMEELYKSYGKGNLELLAINVEPEGPSLMDDFSKEFPHSFPVLFDEDASVQQLYGVFKFPETFIVNKNGIIVERVIGAIDWTDPGALSYINGLMQE